MSDTKFEWVDFDGVSAGGHKGVSCYIYDSPSGFNAGVVMQGLPSKVIKSKGHNNIESARSWCEGVLMGLEATG